jgi:hypothetical protein
MFSTGNITTAPAAGNWKRAKRNVFCRPVSRALLRRRIPAKSVLHHFRAPGGRRQPCRFYRTLAAGTNNRRQQKSAFEPTLSQHLLFRDRFALLALTTLASPAGSRVQTLTAKVPGSHAKPRANRSAFLSFVLLSPVIVGALAIGRLFISHHHAPVLLGELGNARLEKSVSGTAFA